MEFLDCEESIENKYFGEYFQKSRVKVDNHSFKRNPNFVGTNKEISIERKTNGRSYFPELSTESFKETAVTDIDQYFDYGFWAGNAYGCHKRNLNTPEKWEDIEACLTNNATKVTREFNRYDGQHKIHYDLPVTGHFLVPNERQEENRRKKAGKQTASHDNWFYYNGKYYDPSFVYSYSSMRGFFSFSERLTPICPLMKGGYDPLMELGRVDGGKLNRFMAKSFAGAKLEDNNSAKKSSNKKEYLEVDFGGVYSLTHIGTFGGYPRKLQIFPSYDAQELASYYHRQSRRRGRDRRYRRLKYVFTVPSTDEISWVSRYAVYYRDLLTGKWLFFQNFSGNQDLCTEVRHSLSIMTRYLRIVPLESHHRSDMRVLFYGEPSTLDHNDYKGNKKNRNHSFTPSSEEMKIVRYTLTPGVSSPLILDGYSQNGYVYSKNPSKNRAKYLAVRDELDAVDE